MDLSQWVSDGHIEVDEVEKTGAEASVKKMGHKMNYLSQAEIATWAKATQSVHEKWLKEQEDAGRPIAREIYNEARRLITKFNKQ